MSSVSRQGRDFVRVDYTHNIRSVKATVTWKSYILLDPDHGWVMHEFEMDSGKGKRAIKVEYGPVEAGSPTLKRVIETSYGTRSTFDLDEFSFRETPLSEFTLRAAGLPEQLASAGRSGGRSRAPLWFIVSGTIAALGAALLTLLARRSRVFS